MASALGFIWLLLHQVKYDCSFKTFWACFRRFVSDLGKCSHSYFRGDQCRQLVLFLSFRLIRLATLEVPMKWWHDSCRVLKHSAVGISIKWNMNYVFPHFLIVVPILCLSCTKEIWLSFGRVAALRYSLSFLNTFYHTKHDFKFLR